MPFRTILIANRGEIAVRVARTAHALGYRVVAVYSEVDRDAPHVAAADEAVCIGPPAPSESYLNIEAILAAAKATGAEAIHPGYGFLSENAAFARACAEAGLVFVGPPPEVIELLGNKRAAKALAEEAGVPVVPGFKKPGATDAELIAAAEEIGFPLMVKAAAGGGGRGMRLVERADDLPEALRAARAEAQSAFGDAELLLEKAIVEPHHVEIQIFADTHGNVVHLGERDCSVQRRHQKIVEESPSPVVTPELRERMGAAAVAAARAAGYVNAGTVEFLVDRDGNFYFLEVNTRLQVEHPVTELVTGLDLVAWQFEVAEGAPLPLRQEEIQLRGHAMELRLYAEDPANNFLPQAGRIVRWLPPGQYVRVDHAVRDGLEISPYYDPMIAKVIAHGTTRADAIRKLLRALDETRVFGLITNLPFLKAVLQQPAFVAGEASTAFIDLHMQGHETMTRPGPRPETWLGTGIADLVAFGGGFEGRTEWFAWRNASPVEHIRILRCGETERVVRAEPLGHRGDRTRLRVRVTEKDFDTEVAAAEVELVAVEPEAVQLRIDGVDRRIRYVRDGHDLYVDLEDGLYSFVDATELPRGGGEGTGSGHITAPMDGAVTGIFTEVGARVTAGERLVVLEAMKMEHPLKADVDGVVAAIHVKVGDQVKTRQLLVEVTPDEDAT